MPVASKDIEVGPLGKADTMLVEEVAGKVPYNPVHKGYFGYCL